MNREKYLRATKAFLNGEAFDFPTLVRDGMALTGASYKDLAAELGVIPLTVSRWASGLVLPLAGMQRVAIQNLRKRVEGMP